MHKQSVAFAMGNLEFPNSNKDKESDNVLTRVDKRQSLSH